MDGAQFQSHLPHGDGHVVVGIGRAVLEPCALEAELEREAMEFIERVSHEVAPLFASPAQLLIVDVDGHGGACAEVMQIYAQWLIGSTPLCRRSRLADACALSEKESGFHW